MTLCVTSRRLSGNLPLSWATGPMLALRLGKLTAPYAVIRNVGGPAKQAQIGLEAWRIDVLIYDTSMPEARVISNKIHAAIASRGSGGGTIQLPSIFGESGPVGLVDEDRRLPFVQRSYIVTFEV